MIFRHSGDKQIHLLSDLLELQAPEQSCFSEILSHGRLTVYIRFSLRYKRHDRPVFMHVKSAPLKPGLARRHDVLRTGIQPKQSSMLFTPYIQAEGIGWNLEIANHGETKW
jgi:hypothetical protein